MIDNKIIKEVENKYKVDIDSALYIVDKKEQALKMQEVCDKLYEEHGASPEIIRLQAMINTIYHEQNITTEEIVNVDGGDLFVQ